VVPFFIFAVFSIVVPPEGAKGKKSDLGRPSLRTPAMDFPLPPGDGTVTQKQLQRNKLTAPTFYRRHEPSLACVRFCQTTNRRRGRGRFPLPGKKSGKKCPPGLIFSFFAERNPVNVPVVVRFFLSLVFGRTASGRGYRCAPPLTGRRAAPNEV